jgi:6-phosphogluconolactonase
MIVPSPDDRYVLVPDLGTDKVMIYRLDHDAGQLHPHTQTHIDIKTGSGPRHLAFHPGHPIMYVLSELEPILTVVAYDAAGNFNTVDTYPTLPQGDAVLVNLGADIHVTPSGRFLYASNRGHNSLVIYAIDPAGKRLNYVNHQSTPGDWPRAFAIDPSERILVVANQRTNDLHTFHINASTGRLTPTGHKATVPGPTCVKFAIPDIHAG